MIFHVLELKWNEHPPAPPPPRHTSVNLWGYMGNGGLRYISLVLYHPLATIILEDSLTESGLVDERAGTGDIYHL